MTAAKRLGLIFLLLLSVHVSISQLQVKNFFSFTGKKDVAVNVMVQDNNGYLWLGTNDGLYQFDGRSGTEILPASRLLKKEISALYIDFHERVWIGTRNGKVYFLDKESIDSVNFGAQPNTERITSFCESDSGLCIGTYGGGLYAWSKNGVKHFTVENGLSDNVIYKIIGNRSNMIWCGTDAGITQVSSIMSAPRFKIISDKNGLPDNIVRDIVYEQNQLLISMQDSGVCYYNLPYQKIERSPFFTNWGLGTVLNAFTQNPGKVVLATEKNGLLQIDKGTLHVYNYQNYIMTTGINQLFIDREKQIWVASKKGISQFTERRYNFINALNGLSDDKVLALAIDNDNALWAGTTKGISKIMNDDEGRIVIHKISDVEKYTISCATKGPNGNIWFGTYGSGILILSSETKKIIVLNSKDNQLSNDNISNIYFENDRTVYISTLGGGLIKAKIEPDKPESSLQIDQLYTEAEGLGSDYVYAAITDESGKLLVATDGGGIQLLENNTFTDLGKKYNLRSNTVFSLCRDKYNTIWATSNANGILRYDGKSLKSIGMKDGLRDEQPQQIIATDNTLFAINSKGIDKVNCRDNTVSYYDLLDGDLDPNLNAIVFYNNKLYSGTNNGVLTFRTSNESLDFIKPLVFIKGFFLNYKPFPLDSLTEFKYDQNNMALAFDGIWLKNPGKLIFRYKLHGLENDWAYSNEGKLANYYNLGAGSYTFVVQVKNEEDVWSEPATHPFVILTPLWKRWWFWLLVVAVASFTIYMFVTYRLKALQRENLLLERRVKERTYQIEKQSQIIESKNIELEQLSLVASKTDNVVLILDANGKLEYINESFEKLNGMTVEHLKNTYGHTIYELSNNPNIREIIQDAVSNKKSVNYESLNKKVSNGTEMWESSTLTPIFDEEGQLKKIIIIDTDVSLRKKQEQIIVQKNKDITDSISYAKKIQHAILPAESLIHATIPDLFVLYMTKDIVSGDFYWFSHLNNCSIIAAVDCTGHGVPGAFMSLIGYNLLNRIVNEDKITDPKNILMELNNGVLAILHKSESESKDGMDIAICKINHDENTLEYAGAMRPLWIVTKKEDGTNELREIKGDKIPIGTKQKERAETISYTTHTVPIVKNERYYIFTDGYADQFGGPKDKKYSTARLKELILRTARSEFNLQGEQIRQEHLEWKAENEQVDDILVIGFAPKSL